MSFVTDKKVIEKIVILILLVTLFNFISPTISKASDGGGLYVPISQFLRAAGDWIIMGLQGYFMGDSEIKNGNTYQIKYSPGVIFSGDVPALGINFFNPRTFSKDKKETRYEVIDSYQFEVENFKVEGTINSSDGSVLETIGQSKIKEKLAAKGYVLKNFQYKYTIVGKDEREHEDPNYKGYRIRVWI